MKKILALVLALMCAFSFASCGKSETKSEETVKKTPEQEATDTINGFMTALTSFDFEDMKKYVANTDVLPEDIRQFDIKALLKENIPAELSDYTKEFEAFAQNIFDKLSSEMSYKIKKTSQDGDGYVFLIELTAPDFEKIDLETTLAQKLTEDAINGIVDDLIASGDITDATTEEEVLPLIVPPMFELMNQAVAELSLETEITEEEFSVKKDGGKWFVDVTEE